MSPRRTLGRALLAVLLVASPAGAATFLVQPDGSGDFPTIQAGIDAAANGETVALGNGTFTGDGNRDVDFLGKAITVRSQSGDPSTCVLDCEGTSTSPHRGFRLVSGEGPDSRLEGITITRGYTRIEGGGAVFCGNANPTIVGCVLADNTAWDMELGGRGGAILCENVIVADCVFRGNRAATGIMGPGEGGAIAICNTATITGCEFTGNRADANGGAISAVQSQVMISACHFVENVAHSGGAATILQGSSGTLENCRFERNRAGGGTALNIWFGSSPTLDHCTFIANAGSYSGALDIWSDSSPLISACTFYGNTGLSRGTALRCEDASFPVVENCIISFCGEGVPVWCDGTSAADLTCCDVYGNAGGDWVGCIEDQYGVDGNFSADPLFCDPPHDDLTLAAASPCAPENSPGGCGLIGAWPVGCDAPMGADEITATFAAPRLGRVWPVPSVGKVRIACVAPQGSGVGPVVVRILDPQGRCVRRLVLANSGPGVNWLEWDGRGEDGVAMPAGTYFGSVDRSSEGAPRRVILIR